MKTIALLAAAGSLAAVTAPAGAAEFAPTSYGAASHVLNVNIALGIHGNTSEYRDPPRHAKAYGRRAKDRDRYYDRRDRYDDRYDSRYRTYDRYGRYVEPRRVTRRDRVWQGDDGRYYCKRDNGTTGLIIGAAGGALLGREIDRRGDRTLGTVLGGAIGALLGREIDRGTARCR